ncbi:MAG: MMPL family transporter [Nitriliruptoraceae bacterium]|nr:MMPL family transporter [Nitriliruptoraceae bacterium]
MIALFDGLARIVSRRPAVVVAVMVVLTLAIGAMSSQAVNEDGVAVDNELSAALEVIDDTFGDPQSVVQVVVERTDGDDIRSVDGLRAAIALQEAIEEQAADTLIDGDGQQPPVASWLGGAQIGLEMAGLDVDDLDDGAVLDLQDQALEMLPPQVGGLFEGLLADGDPPATGLIIVFQDTTGLDEEAASDRQFELAEVVEGVELPAGYQATTFSFGLLLGAGDIGPEIGRLFGTALLIILLVLAVVYWVKPDAGQRLRLGRRTAADVGLTLVVIVFAVVWMQGLGVLLGPDYAGLIGYFSPQTQIVPILIIGLGVDFAIHLLARYRGEVGGDAPPERALATAMRTVGLTLLLCTAATAIGFLTNLASPVDFLATLGVLAAVGILAAFLLTVTFLPAIRLMLDRRAQRLGRLPVAALSTQRESRLPRAVGRTAWLAERVPVPTVLVAVALVVVGGYGFTQLDSEFNLTDFVPQDEPLLDTFEVISEQFNGGFEESTEVLLTGSLATPDAHNALVDSVEAAGDVDDVETLGGEPDATSIVSVLAGARDDDDLADELEQLGAADGARVEDDADVTAIYELLIAETSGADDVIAFDGDEVIARVTLRTSAGQSGAVALADGLDAAFSPARDAGLEVVPTSQEIVQARIGEDIEDSQIISLVIALGAAMALLVLHFWVAERAPMVGVITVLPVGLVLALTFGAMAATGIPLNPVTATLAALSIGIGVPFTIHVTSRFLEERRRGTVDGEAPMRRTLTQTGGALAGSALTTAIGFGVLVTSTLVPFEQLGYVIVYAIVFSLIAAILVLPSLLVLWDRRAPVSGEGDEVRSEQAVTV